MNREGTSEAHTKPRSIELITKLVNSNSLGTQEHTHPHPHPPTHAHLYMYSLHKGSYMEIHQNTINTNYEVSHPFAFSFEESFTENELEKQKPQ